MKKLILMALMAAAVIVLTPSSVKADAALNAANNFANIQNNWAGQQVNYYNAYEVPVMNAYNVAMSNQYAQALAARFQSDALALQSNQMAAANAYQLWANEYAHQQNIATQYANMKNMVTYNTINNWDTSFYNNQEMVLKTYGMMFGQYPFPQIQ